MCDEYEAACLSRNSTTSLSPPLRGGEAVVLLILFREGKRLFPPLLFKEGLGVVRMTTEIIYCIGPQNQAAKQARNQAATPTTKTQRTSN